MHHRFVYVSTNSKLLNPFHLMILPFLHERKLYLNRTKKNCDYFYCTIRRRVSEDHAQTFFVTMNLTESKYYVYSQMGILKKRVDFSDITNKYGSLTTISNNGHILVFRQRKQMVINIFILTLARGLVKMKTICLKDAVFDYIAKLEEEGL